MKESKKILVLTLVAVLAGLSLAAAATLNDAEIQSAIETKFENKKILNGGGPWVAVEKGVVTLEGKVKSVWAKNEAIKLAMEVDDVIAVEDELEIAFGESDEKVAEEVAKKIRTYSHQVLSDPLEGRLSARAPASSLRLSRYRPAPRSHVDIGIRALLETR